MLEKLKNFLFIFSSVPEERQPNIISVLNSFSCPKSKFYPMFYLISFPGLEAIEHWIFIPFFLMDLVAISGSYFFLIIIKINPPLHMSSLILSTILSGCCGPGLSVFTLPTSMGIFGSTPLDLL